MVWLSRRLLPVLQLTRMALVFTAISNGLCGLLLWSAAGAHAMGEMHRAPPVSWATVAALVIVAVGLYGYGVSLNDIIDRRRDRQLAADRPLPSGRVGVATAHLICIGLGLLALAGGVWYAYLTGGNWMSLLLVVWTGLLITFYDLAGKYLVAPGLLTLGLIRFFHAAVAAPVLPVVLHPLLLMNHVAVVSTICYAWEAKRPQLTRTHFWAVLGGLVVLNGLALGVVAWRRIERGAAAGMVDALRIDAALLWPAAAGALFLLCAWILIRRSVNRREAGQKLMLYGLLWLIVYDAAFVSGYVSLLAGVVILGLLPVSYLAVQLMRWWSGLLAAAQRQEFKRARA
jgi:4-hydroxybenzoate polyprenyltransferase